MFKSLVALWAAFWGLEALYAEVTIFADTNRDGVVNEDDIDGRNTWERQGKGAYFIANVDDDNKDGMRDCDDSSVNSGGDTEDLARIRIQLDPQTLGRTSKVSVTVKNGKNLINLFERTKGIGNGWQFLASDVSQVKAEIELGIEAKHFAGVDGWDGLVTIEVEAKDGSGYSLGTDSVQLKVAPWIMLPNSARTAKIFVSQGRYSSAKYLLQNLKELGSTPVHAYQTGMWQEMWMQDTMEIGYTEMPGMEKPMYAVLRADRCGQGSCDRFAHSLLGQDFGFFTVKRVGVQGHGAWDDWFGNLEVSHPVPEWPLGRIYFGTNLNRGLATFLYAQQVQKPFEIDPTWLMIKHVDEVMNFVPGPSGEARLVVVSPRRAARIAGKNLNAYNAGVQAKVDEAVKTAVQALGLEESQIVELPLFFSHGGVNQWSNPVNSIHVNGKVALGNTMGHAGQNELKSTAYGRDIEKQFRALSLAPVWVNDIAYQPNHGNVHCATNTLKVPVVEEFWSL